jgi:hypothetical protein
MSGISALVCAASGEVNTPNQPVYFATPAQPGKTNFPMGAAALDFGV